MPDDDKIDSHDSKITLSSVHPKEPTEKEVRSKYAFMIWDGMEFFGFAFDKLPRLRGHKESWKDKL